MYIAYNFSLILTHIHCIRLTFEAGSTWCTPARPRCHLARERRSKSVCTSWTCSTCYQPPPSSCLSHCWGSLSRERRHWLLRYGILPLSIKNDYAQMYIHVEIWLTKNKINLIVTLIKTDVLGRFKRMYDTLKCMYSYRISKVHVDAMYGLRGCSCFIEIHILHTLSYSKVLHTYKHIPLLSLSLSLSLPLPPSSSSRFLLYTHTCTLFSLVVHSVSLSSSLPSSSLPRQWTTSSVGSLRAPCLASSTGS